MASVFKRSDGKHWFAAYRAADGRRMKVATKSLSREEAQRLADRMELEAREEREKKRVGVSLNGINDAMQRATQLAMSNRLDFAAARGLINDLLVAAGQLPLDSMTNRGWCESWKRGKEGTVKAKTKYKYDQVVRDWLAFLGAKAEQPMEMMAKAAALAFRDKMSGDGLAARTMNHAMKQLRGMYQGAVEHGHLGRNPFMGISSQLENRDDTRREPFTIEEVATLIRVAEGDWKGLVIVAATTGLRLMDATRLTWGALDFEEKVIRIRTGKTGAKLTLPIHPDFAKWLPKQGRGTGAAPIFSSLVDKAGAGKKGLSGMFKKLMERAKISPGIARKRKEGSRGVTTSKKSFHSLRHFVATQLAMSGVRADVARSITGHSDAVTHGNYVTPDQASLKAAVREIKLA